MNRPLPWWRLGAAILILGGMIVVLLSLAPFYLRDWQLRNYYARSLLRGAQLASLSDSSIEKDITGHAEELGLPVTANNLQIVREGGNVRMDLRYTVHFDFYQVDLHFHTAAGSK